MEVALLAAGTAVTRPRPAHRKQDITFGSGDGTPRRSATSQNAVSFVTNKGAFCHGFKAFQHRVVQLWLKKPSIRTYTEAFKYRTQGLIAPDTCPGIVL